MRISELILVLDTFKQRHGDAPVHIHDEWDDFNVGSIYFEDGLDIDGTPYRYPRVIIEANTEYEHSSGLEYKEDA